MSQEHRNLPPRPATGGVRPASPAAASGGAAPASPMPPASQAPSKAAPQAPAVAAPVAEGRDPAAFAAWLVQQRLRPTRHRLTIAAWLFPEGPGRVVPAHFTAEDLHRRAENEGVRISLATIYNTLNQFSEAGLLRRVPGGGEGCSFYDTNTEDHHHIFYEESNTLVDVPLEELDSLSRKAGSVSPPDGKVEVMIRVKAGPRGPGGA